MIEERAFERAAPMRNFLNGTAPSTSSGQLLLAYVADLELEVDRLRKHSQFVQHEVRGSLKRIQTLCADAVGVGKASPPLAEIDQTVKQLAAVLRDLQEPPGYHPAHDQVVAIARVLETPIEEGDLAFFLEAFDGNSEQSAATG